MNKIAIIGLGYVGLPLALEFGKKIETIGFDINSKRVQNLINRVDSNNETNEIEFISASKLTITSKPNDIKGSNFFIITVPTPIDNNKNPDLRLLKDATKLVAKYIKKDDIVVYESTVYPGATEEICIPLLEKYSKLVFNKDFYCAYSPERINPGDKEKKLKDLVKVISASSPETLDKVESIYQMIIKAGTYRASSIKVAEAAKIIENTQRDLNIALVNELALIFKKMNIPTEEVLSAAATKWNFHKFHPGLVGGHCIGVDPYYLTYKALQSGYDPKIILAGRDLNDNMSNIISEEIINLMHKKKINISGAKILIMGFAFKENCSDVRNTKVADLYNNLKSMNCDLDVYDPLANQYETSKIYEINLIQKPRFNYYDVVVFAVNHNEFKQLNKKNIDSFCKKNYILYDLKYHFSIDDVDGRI